MTLLPRALAVVASAALLASVVTGVEAPAHAKSRVLVATGYAQVGSAKTSDVTRDGRYLRTIAVDALTLAGPASVTSVGPEAHALRKKAQKHGRKAVVLVSNYSDELGDFDEALAHRMLTSPANRRSVVAALVSRARLFDGVQVDLESLQARDRAGLVAFTRELRAALPRRASLSMAFMASDDLAGYRARGYALRELAPSLSTMVLMAYDQHGSWSGPGPVGSLPWARKQLRFFASQLPDAKVDLGVGTYGYQWTAGRRATKTLSVPRARKVAGSKARWSAKHGEWHAKLSGGRTIWWSDKRSLAAKEKIARAEGVHGVSIWQIGSSGRLR